MEEGTSSPVPPPTRAGLGDKINGISSCELRASNALFLILCLWGLQPIQFAGFSVFSFVYVG